MKKATKRILSLLVALFIGIPIIGWERLTDYTFVNGLIPNG